MASEQEQLDEIDFQIKSGQISAEQVLAWQQLEQQLAQARGEAIRLRSENFKQEAQLRFEQEENARQLGLRLQLQQENAQARALLERYQKSGSLSTYAEGRQLFVDVETFLGRPPKKEASDGE